MTKDAALLTVETENKDGNAEEEKKSLVGQSLDDIIKAGRKNKRKGPGRGRGRGRRRGRGGRGRGGYGLGGYMHGLMPPAHPGYFPQGYWPAAGQDQGQYMNQFQPLQVLYKLVQKHGLNPTIVVLDTCSEQGKTRVQVQVELDISRLQGKPSGSFCLRQLAWGNNKQEAKRNAVGQILAHQALRPLIGDFRSSHPQPHSESLFPIPRAQPQKKKKKEDKQDDGPNCRNYINRGCKDDDCKLLHVIPENLWKSNPGRAIALFEEFMTTKGKLLTYKFNPDEKDEDKFTCICVVDGANEGEGTGSRFLAKVEACQNTHGTFKEQAAAAETNDEAKAAVPKIEISI